MALDVSKFLARFVDEAREHCAGLSQGLLDLEKGVGDPEEINSLFRSAHTIKGSSLMMKLQGVSELAHKMEDVLDAMRSGKLALNAAISDLLFRALDALSAMVEGVARGETEAAAPTDLCEELALAAGGVAGSDKTSSPPALAPAFEIFAPAPPAEPAVVPPRTDPPPSVATTKAPQIDYLRVNAGKLDNLISLMGEIISEHGRFKRQIARLRELARESAHHHDTIAALLAGDDDGDRTPLLAEASALQVRLRQAVREMADASLLQEHLFGDLQETSLKLRMQPLSTIFEPLRRTVRDLARDSGKEIDFVVDGGETELDRKIIDRLGEALLHMIRNALDHGLEPPAERTAAGKPGRGTIHLSAAYDSGCVVISLGDDGRGLNIEAIRSKALAKKLLTAEALTDLSRAEIANLIFLPGFSTSPIITDLSGRGVGLDVVKKSLDELKGAVFINSREGEGTTFVLRLPLNLAVFPLFFVATGSRVFALPATSIVEVLAVDRQEIIDIVNKRAIRLREQIIPIEYLELLLMGRSQETAAAQVRIAILRDGEEKIGLVVEEILGREETVVKPLPAHLKELRLVGGVTVGVGNSLISVLNVPELFRLARDLVQPAPGVGTAAEERRQTVLVVDDSINTREIERSILEAHGYSVDTAEDGEEAWEKTQSLHYDLIVTDVEMPRLDGFSLTKRLRNEERYRDVPIVIVTSLEKEADKSRGIAVGANAYIVKRAFDQSNLLETVRNLIG